MFVPRVLSPTPTASFLCHDTESTHFIEEGLISLCALKTEILPQRVTHFSGKCRRNHTPISSLVEIGCERRINESECCDQTMK